MECENSIKSIESEKDIGDSVFEIIEETIPNKLVHHENLNDHLTLLHPFLQQVHQV